MWYCFCGSLPQTHCYHNTSLKSCSEIGYFNISDLAVERSNYTSCLSLVNLDLFRVNKKSGSLTYSCSSVNRFSQLLEEIHFFNQQLIDAFIFSFQILNHLPRSFQSLLLKFTFAFVLGWNALVYGKGWKKRYFSEEQGNIISIPYLVSCMVKCNYGVWRQSTSWILWKSDS